MPNIKTTIIIVLFSSNVVLSSRCIVTLDGDNSVLSSVSFLFIVPKNTALYNLNKYKRVKTAPTTAKDAAKILPCWTRDIIINNFAKKPPKGGKPIIESAHSIKPIETSGIIFESPPNFLKSVIPVCLSIIPTDRNKPALPKP